MGGHPGRLAVLVIVLVSGVMAKDDHSAESQTPKPTAGELDHCLKDKTEKKLTPVSKGATLGRGWDILDFSLKDYPMALTYKDCDTLFDVEIFVPDQAYQISAPRTEYSTIKTFQSVKEYFADQAAGFSSGSIVPVPHPTFPGVFYWRNELLTKKMRESKTSTTGFKTVMGTIEETVTKYILDLKDVTKLSKNFTSVVKKIYGAIDRDKPEVADFLSETLVKTYGTHVIEGVTVGGKIVRAFTERISTTNDTQEQMSNFKSDLNLMFSYKPEKSKITGDPTPNLQKPKYLIHFDTRILGGEDDNSKIVFKWVSSVDDNMDVIEQRGKPISELITKKNFPDYEHSMLWEVSETISAAIRRYYRMNTVEGCMDIDKPGFNPHANVENKALCGVFFPFFGGHYGSLQMGNYEGGRAPPHEIVNNPLTSARRCTEDYRPVALSDITEDMIGSRIFTKLRYCVGMVETQNFHYGGYTTTYSEPCPAKFTAYPLKPAMPELKLCLSKGYVKREDIRQFGGIYTCNRGNAMAMPVQVQNKLDPAELTRRLEKTLSHDWEFPKACPPNFWGEVVLDKITIWVFGDDKKISNGTKLKKLQKECPVVLCSKGPGINRKPPFTLYKPKDMNSLEPGHDDDGESDQEDFPFALFALMALGFLAVLVVVVVVIVAVVKKKKKQQAKGKGTPSKKTAGEAEDAVAESPRAQTPVETVMSLMFSPASTHATASTAMSSRN